MEPRGEVAEQPASLRAAPVSAILPTCQRLDKLVHSLRAILACEPPPAEVIVHVDAGDVATAPALLRDFPCVRVLESSDRAGPGGGRNRLVAAAACHVIASFDDDSYPLDSDFFAESVRLLESNPRVAVLAAEIFQEGEVIAARSESLARVADFVGCGCAFRKDAFVSTSGYVPLALAYGMEETDLSLRLQDHGWSVLKSGSLRVFHATKLAHHRSANIARASIANVALLAYLRYPLRCWWIGVAQVVNRVVWLLRRGRIRGVVGGIFGIPRHLWRHRRYRSLVTAKTLRAYLNLRRQPIPV